MVEPHLRIYQDRSELVLTDGSSTTYREGKPSPPAQQRAKNIRNKLKAGWFRDAVVSTISDPTITIDLSQEHKMLIDGLVNSLTSEVGRCVVGLTVVQMTIKALEPTQSIRLHKGGRGDFSWMDGITMRTIDSDFVTPILREFDLLRVNKYGNMMTRSLAENYPYTKFYKASIKGAKSAWLEITDEMELGQLKAMEGLRYVILSLFRRSEVFVKKVEQTLSALEEYLNEKPSFIQISSLIRDHIDNSTYSPRLLEVAAHSLMQVAEEHGSIDGHLVPLSQMRSANKKHNNVGDVEIEAIRGTGRIIEAWDAKYGKPYLLDEVYELYEKLNNHPDVEIAGFITDSEPRIDDSILKAIEEVKELTGVEVVIHSYNKWVNQVVERIGEDKDRIGSDWIRAYTESLCQKRREMAPIDEPSEVWIESLKILFEKTSNSGSDLTQWR